MISLLPRKSYDENKKGSSKNNVDLRAIGVGLPRTGTTSLAAALEILGFGPCHNMDDIFRDSNRTLKFIPAYNREKVDFHELMKGYGSTVDVPTADFYKEICQAYPNAKVILTVRDSDEKWFESFQNTIGTIATSNFYYFCVYLIRNLRLQYILGRKIFANWESRYDEVDPSMHEKHNKRIINENKDGEVLVFNVKEGWAPLCKFLEVNIPENIPFPHINDADEILGRIRFAKVIGLCTWIAMGALFILSIYLIMQIT